MYALKMKLQCERFAKMHSAVQLTKRIFSSQCIQLVMCDNKAFGKCSEAFARTGKPIEEIEKELLNGQKLQGPETAREVYTMLVKQDLLDSYPMFASIHQIFEGAKDVKQFIDCLRSHPAHI